jgi:hypothetical protein
MRLSVFPIIMVCKSLYGTNHFIRNILNDKGISAKEIIVLKPAKEGTNAENAHQLSPSLDRLVKALQKFKEYIFE